MPAMMILVWSLDVVDQCAVWTIALVCTTGFLELGSYKFSWAMDKSITHLTCFAGPTVIAFPKFSVLYTTRKTSWHSSHCLFEFIFIGLSRDTIVFSYCPQIAKASLHVGGQCLEIKQNIHSQSYISLCKLYKRKKSYVKKGKKPNNDYNKTMLRLTGIQQEGVFHAHACIRWATIAWEHQIWWREIKNSRKVTVLSKAILLVLKISYFDKNRTFSKEDFSAVGFSWPFKDFKDSIQNSLFPYKFDFHLQSNAFLLFDLQTHGFTLYLGRSAL